MDLSIVKYVNSEWPCNKSVACPLPSVEDAGVAPTVYSSTPGGHPGRRLVEVGIRSVFSVPGDFNITLLMEPGLNLSGCCNEFNAGYAADGCAVTFRVRGLGVNIAISGACSENLCVTCSVGGPISSDYGTNGVAISGAYSENLPVTCTVGGPNSSDYGPNGIAISGAYRENLPVTCSVGGPNSSDYGPNGIAISGAYRENLPVTCSVGGPNSSDYGTNGIAISGAYSENLPVTCSVGGPNSSDHTIGLPGFSLEYRRFQTVTWIQVIVNHLDDAHKLTDYDISITLTESEHVYISISCNLAAIQHPTLRQNVPYSLAPRDGKSIEKCMVQTTQENQLEVRIRSVFTVPGDFNITLLMEPGLNLSGCCNELNAGYAADGCAVTFTVRVLGVTITISGAYSENLPVTCSVGAPISSDYGTNGVAISGSYSENLPVT